MISRGFGQKLKGVQLPNFSKTVFLRDILKNMRVFFLILLVCFPSHVFAESYKDSIYFMLDDGEMSLEEMQQEAEFVHQECAKNVYQSNYIDCECIAGAFLNEREKLGPMVPQSNILRDVYEKHGRKCANTAEIAGNAYQRCEVYARHFRPQFKDGDDFCQCVSKSVVRGFQSNPVIRPRYLQSLYARGYVDCTYDRDRIMGRDRVGN